MYKVGRRFEYRVIEFLRNNGIEVIRNELSRKPDLIIKAVYPYLEVKKNLKPKKVRNCWVVKDVIGFLKGKEVEMVEEGREIEDRWITITKGKRGFILVIPFVWDLNYLSSYLKRLNFEMEAYNSYKLFQIF